MERKKHCGGPMPAREELRDLPQAPRLIMEISRLLRSRMREDEPEGVMAQSSARLLLAHLAVCGEANQLKLAELAGLQPPTVSVLLSTMEREGYVCRVPDAHDRRVMRVTLSEKGKAFDSAHLCRIFTNDQQAMRGFDAAERETLERLLVRVRDNLKER